MAEAATSGRALVWAGLAAGAAIAALAGTASASAQTGEDPDADLYEARCGGCHSIAANRVGPAHRGVVGRVAGTAPGFSYSNALRGAGFRWTPAQLDRWLQNPGALVPGTRMGFRLTNPQERQRIIAYLSTQR